MKLYLDENLSPRIAELLRARGLDATSAHEAGNTQLTDAAQLRYATDQARAIVTCDVADFVVLAAPARHARPMSGLANRDEVAPHPRLLPPLPVALLMSGQNDA